MKKILFAILGIAMLGISACSYKSCPTYAKAPAKLEITTPTTEVNM